MVPAEYTDQLRSVEIIHDDIHRIDFAYLAEVFRFMGIFVCENILIECQDGKTEIEKNTEHSAYIYVGHKVLGEREAALLGSVWDKDRADVEAEYEECLSRLPEGAIFLYGDIMGRPMAQEGQDGDDPFGGMLFQLEKGEQLSILNKLMEAVSEIISKKTAGKISVGKFSELLNVFVENELWFHSLNLQYYSKQRSYAAENARSAFLKAHGEIQEVKAARAEGYGQDDGLQFVYDYAFLWCEVKTNIACDYCHEILYFLRERIVGRCEELCRQYPEFDNARVLLGLCYLPFGHSDNAAVKAFKDALDGVKTECFASPVYYWIGKRFEKYPDKKRETKIIYTRANNCKRKFRNNFKLAVIERDEGNYASAENLFKEITDKLSIKDALCLVDPLEIEYLFKTYTQLAYIYYKQKEYTNAIRMGEHVIDIMKKYIIASQGEENGRQKDFFKLFYQKDDEAERYRSILRNRLSVGMAYKIIAESYAGLMDLDKAKEYRDKIPVRN